MRARNDALPKLTGVIPQLFSREQLPAGYYLVSAFNATWKRGNDSRSPLQESAHQRAPTCPLTANYGEIAVKFVICIPLRDFVVPSRPLHALTITYESPFFPIIPYVSFFLFIVESAGYYAVA